MDHDEAKIEEMILALLYLTTFQSGRDVRAWKAHDWGAMQRLYDAGFISDPRSSSKSVVLTDDGVKRSKALFKQHVSSKA